MLSAGQIVDGKYLVLRLIGEGGMGVVFEARNVRLERRVAIKVMHARLAYERDLVRRFEREAQSAGRIGSTHIVDVLDIGDLQTGERYMVMEYLDGESLHARLKAKGRFAPYEIVPIATQLLSGLSRVHDAGIIHRDLKPHNIFLVRGEGSQDFVKILDFGVCKMTAQQPTGDVKSGIGSLFGTLPYMAPELFEEGSARLDGRADLYSTGILLYRCVTGQLPYQADNLFEMMQKLRERRAKHVRDIAPEVDPGFAEIIDRAIAWDRNERFESARVFKQALLAWSKQAARPPMLTLPLIEEANVYGEGPDAEDRTTARLPNDAAPGDPYDAERTIDKRRRRDAKVPIAKLAVKQLAPSSKRAPKVSRQKSVTNEQTGTRRATQKSVPADDEIPIDVQEEDEELAFDFDGKVLPIRAEKK